MRRSSSAVQPQAAGNGDPLVLHPLHAIRTDVCRTPTTSGLTATFVRFRGREVPVCEIHARTVARWGADAEAKRGNALAVVERTSGRRVVATDSTAVLKFRAAFAEFICMVNAYAYLQSILVSLREREHVFW